MEYRQTLGSPKPVFKDFFSLKINGWCRSWWNRTVAHRNAPFLSPDCLPLLHIPCTILFPPPPASSHPTVGLVASPVGGSDAISTHACLSCNHCQTGSQPPRPGPHGNKHCTEPWLFAEPSSRVYLSILGRENCRKIALHIWLFNTLYFIYLLIYFWSNFERKQMVLDWLMEAMVRRAVPVWLRQMADKCLQN